MQTTSSSAPLSLAQAKPDPGFKLPGANSGPAEAGAKPADPSSSRTAHAASVEVVPLEGAPVTDTSSRDLTIGGGVLVVLMMVFFFARNAFVQHLVVRRVTPSSAGSAGWLLFVGLSFLSAAAVLAMINAGKFLSLAITGPLLVVGIVSLIGAAMVGRR